MPPSRLVPKLPRDIETICLKCLEKDPAKRYDDAQALAEDLDRFQADEPILARPIGRGRAPWRWCRRNRLVAGLAGGIALAMMLGTIVATYCLPRTRGEQLASREGDRGPGERGAGQEQTRACQPSRPRKPSRRLAGPIRRRKRREGSHTPGMRSCSPIVACTSPR